MGHHHHHQRLPIRFTVWDLFADERCTTAILGFLRTTEVGSRMGPRAMMPGEIKEAEEGGAGEVE